MNPIQVQEELSIIKQMIEKTRRETAESGHFLIFVGISSIFFTLFLAAMNKIFHLGYLSIAILAVALIINGVIGYFTTVKEAKKEHVTTYPKIILGHVWGAIGLPALMAVFVLPFLKVYPFSALPVVCAMLMGIPIYITGAIYELPFIKWCSLAWWGGALGMAFVRGMPRAFIMVAVIFLGWILPGLIMNRRYKNRSKDHES